MVKCTNKGCSNVCDKQLMGGELCFECYLAWANGDLTLGVQPDEELTVMRS